MAKIRFYLDENVPPAVAEGLTQRGIPVVTVRELGLLGDDDANHLRRAAAMNCVLCTHDSDFVVLAKTGEQHAGIVFGQPEKHNIGTWVHFLERVYIAYTAELMVNRIEYVRLLSK